MTLGAVAAATSRVTIGPGITNAYTRHPGVTAAGIATLDDLSGGRAALGVGAGGSLTPDAARHRTSCAAHRVAEPGDRDAIAARRRARRWHRPDRRLLQSPDQLRPGRPADLVRRARASDHGARRRARRRVHPVVRPQGAHRRSRRRHRRGGQRSRTASPDAGLHDDPGHHRSSTGGREGGSHVPSRRLTRRRERADRGSTRRPRPRSGGPSPRAAPRRRLATSPTSGSTGSSSRGRRQRAARN